MMKGIFIFIFLLNSFVRADLLTPDKKEIGRIGYYEISSQKLPGEYKYIWSQSKSCPNGLKVEYTSAQKDLRRGNHKFKWRVYVPSCYREENKSGLIILATRVKFEKLPIAWKKLCEELNIILISAVHDNLDSWYSLEISLASYQIIEKRYSIDPLRSYYIGMAGQNVNHDFIVHSADRISGVVFFNCYHMFSTSTPSGFNGLSLFYPKLLEEAYKNFYTLVSYDRDFGDQQKRHFTRNMFFENTLKKSGSKKVRNLNYKMNASLGDNYYDLPLYTKIFYEQSFESLLDVLNLKKTYQNMKIQNQLETAKKLEADKHLGKALEAYKESHEKFKNDEAFEDFKRLASQLNEMIGKSNELFKSKNYPEAFFTATQTVKLFGTKLTKDVHHIISTCKKDKKIVLEIKAASYLAKAEAALKQSPVPVDKIRAACDKVIQTVPGTVTADKANTILEKLK